MPIKTINVTDSGIDLHGEVEALHSLLKGLRPNEPIKFDLSNLTWLRPTMALAIASYIDSVPGSSFVRSRHQAVSQYLRAIDFPGGITRISEFEPVFTAGRTYTPISILERTGGPDRAKVEARFEDLVASFVGDSPINRSMFIYPLAELTGNIFDHGDTGRGYVIGQYYPQAETLEIAVIDRGQGLAERYLKSQRPTPHCLDGFLVAGHYCLLAHQEASRLRGFHALP